MRFTKPKRYIVHQVNCHGVMGAGFAKQIKEKYPECYRAYREHSLLHSPDNLLGTVFIWDSPEITIFNMYSQLDYGVGKCQINYRAMQAALSNIRQQYPTQIILAPYKIGCGLAGGDWKIVEKILVTYHIQTSKNIVL